MKEFDNLKKISDFYEYLSKNIEQVFVENQFTSIFQSLQSLPDAIVLLKTVNAELEFLSTLQSKLAFLKSTLKRIKSKVDWDYKKAKINGFHVIDQSRKAGFATGERLLLLDAECSDAEKVTLEVQNLIDFLYSNAEVVKYKIDFLNGLRSDIKFFVSSVMKEESNS